VQPSPYPQRERDGVRRPVTVLSVVAGMRFGPALIGRWGARTSLFVSMLINGAGIVLLAVGMAPDASFWTLVPGIAVWGVGRGMTFTAMFVKISVHHGVALFSWELTQPGGQAAPVATGYGVVIVADSLICRAYNFFG